MIKTDTTGWNAIVRELLKLKDKSVKVGWLGAKAGQRKSRRVRSSKGKASAGGSAATIAEIAATLEYGSQHMPARPVLRPGLLNHEKELQDAAAQIFSAVINKGAASVPLLNQFGLAMEALVKREIRTITKPPLRPATIKRKGSSKPWIDTGQLHSSVTYAIETTQS